jgi:hypothetical protein
MLTLNSLEPGEPGDAFSNMRLGLHNLFWNVNTVAVGEKKRVLNSIAACTLAIGVVADPGFSDEEDHTHLVLDVARLTDGVIFNGVGMLDSSGHLLLDRDGRTKI